MSDNIYKKDLSLLIKEGKVVVEEMKIIRRKANMTRRLYLIKGSSEKRIGFINRNMLFYVNFETRIPLESGDVFMFTFNFECGTELFGPHFCAVLFDSSELNQLVRVVPLHSLKEDKEINPSNEIVLGPIPGVDNGKVAVAMVNQTKNVDKTRLLDKVSFSDLDRIIGTDEYKENKRIRVQNKFKYRLNEEQYKKLRAAVNQYFFTGFIKHEK